MLRRLFAALATAGCREPQFAVMVDRSPASLDAFIDHYGLLDAAAVRSRRNRPSSADSILRATSACGFDQDQSHRSRAC